jgi:FkbM family methyltransferase
MPRNNRTWRCNRSSEACCGTQEIEVEVSAESDMSSILPQSELLRRVSPSSRVVGRERVPLRRLDGLFNEWVRDGDRAYLKIDAQGFEPRVLEGARGALPRIVGIEVEMALVRCYEGERDWREMIDALNRDGFALHLLLPGYFERKLGRQLQVDGVFFRPPFDATGATA